MAYLSFLGLGDNKITNTQQHLQSTEQNLFLLLHLSSVIFPFDTLPEGGRISNETEFLNSSVRLLGKIYGYQKYQE